MYHINHFFNGHSLNILNRGQLTIPVMTTRAEVRVMYVCVCVSLLMGNDDRSHVMETETNCLQSHIPGRT